VRLVPWRLVLLTEGLVLVAATLGRHGLDDLFTHAARRGALSTELLGAAASKRREQPAHLSGRAAPCRPIT